MLKRAALVLVGASLFFCAGCGRERRDAMRTIKDYVRDNGQVLRKHREGPYLVYIVQSDSLYRTAFRKLTVDRDNACVIRDDFVDQSRHECSTNNVPVGCDGFKSDPDLFAYINWM
jgi:hypothetical protein